LNEGQHQMQFKTVRRTSGPILEKLESRHLLCGVHSGEVNSPDLASPAPASADYLARFNFGPEVTQSVPGYTLDTGAAYGASPAGMAHGWTPGAINGGKVRSSTRSADDRYDSFLKTELGSTWELSVPDGFYTVRLVAGDARSSSRALVFTAEGVSAIDGETSRQQRWLESTLTVPVTDGKLTIRSERPGVINFVDVAVAGSAILSASDALSEEAPPGARTLSASENTQQSTALVIEPARKVNFQPANVATVGGYLVDSGQTYGPRSGATYGWSLSHASAVVDRNANSNQLLDTNVGFINSARWEMAVANGQYNVTVGVGDSARSSNNNVWIEGRQLFNYLPLGSNQFRRATITVTVSDGRLTLGAGSATTGTTRLNYVEVVATGLTPPSPPSVTAFPTSVAWTAATANPVARAEAVGALVGNKLYVMGGLTGTVAGTQKVYAATTRCDYYDYTTNKWTRTADMPEAFSHASGVVVGDRIWFVGGYVGNQPGPATAKVWIFDTGDNRWSRGPDLPVARGAGGAALIGSSIYYVGGMDRDRSVDRGNLWALDLNQPFKGWVAKAPMPTPRNHLAVIATGGKLYAVSGQRDEMEDQVPMRHLEVYNPATNIWSRKADIPAARSHTTSSIFVYRGRLVVLGGEQGYGITKRELFAYDTVTNSWSLMGMLPSSRSTMVSGLLPDGRIVTATGNNPAVTATTWIGRPA